MLVLWSSVLDHPTHVVLGNQTCLGLLLWETLVDVSSVSLQLLTFLISKCLNNPVLLCDVIYRYSI